MGFEGKLAERVASRKAPSNLRKSYASLVGIAFVVLTLTSSTTAVPQVVIHVGTHDSVARYLGSFEGKSNVIKIGVFSIDDWACIKVPFKGRISDLKSFSFSEYIILAADTQLEPYVVLKLSEGRNLVCHPESSYANGTWKPQTLTWETRDTVLDGKWVRAPVPTESLLAPLSMWTTIIGDQEIISISVYVGGWEIHKPYQCYLGDLTINGKLVDLANVGRISVAQQESPAGL